MAEPITPRNRARHARHHPRRLGVLAVTVTSIWIAIGAYFWIGAALVTLRLFRFCKDDLE